MRQQSARRAAQQRARTKRLRATTHEPHRCQWPWGCTAEAVDAHESLSRARGGDPLDPDWLLCRAHHDAVTSAHGERLAGYVAAGLIRSAGPRNRCGDVNETATVPGMAERKPIAARIGPAADTLITETADAAHVSRALVFRAMLAVAAVHMAEVREKIASMNE